VKGFSDNLHIVSPLHFDRFCGHLYCNVIHPTKGPWARAVPYGEGLLARRSLRQWGGTYRWRLSWETHTEGDSHDGPDTCKVTLPFPDAFWAFGPLSILKW